MGKEEIDRIADADSRRPPIAIVGIGCRFPGHITGPPTFWQLLQQGKDAIGEIPPDRIDVASFYDPRPSLPGKMTTRWGGFIDRIEMFDADFFGISPREAERMDPQQRLLLEVAWEALEDGGHRIDRVSGGDTGIFVGMWVNDYEARLFADPRAVDFYTTTGTGRYTASGRLSYFLGVRGPSLTIDTACSSSLVAVHLACRSIWSGECSLALAGGANLILQPHIAIAYSQTKMMAPDGRCKFGDASANGYVRSEGAALVVLKPLAAALTDGDPIYALIHGSAVNNDGSSSGNLTTPGRLGHEELLRKAYSDAGISPGRVQYVEAHGTGTRAGDPVEVGALGTVLGTDRAPGNVCYIGSVKTNFGHTEGAAGVAGLIKTALMLKHRMIPASLHFNNPTPAIPWADLPFEVPHQLTPWPSSECAIAGVSAFGISGTNAHIVLSEAPGNRSGDESIPSDNLALLLPISARSPEALTSFARAYCSMMQGEQSPPLRDIAFTASLRRTHHEYRLAAVSETASGMCDLLTAFARGEQVSGVSIGQVKSGKAGKIVFVCPGQGSQWLGMGRQLTQQEPVLREALHQCDLALRPFVNWSLVEQLEFSTDDPRYRLGEIDVIQPILVCLEIALAALWRSWGVAPDAIVGHSMGEIAAAFISGALKLDDAMSIICHRSRLLRTVSGNGAMAFVALSMKDAEHAIAKCKDRVSAAVSNSPSSTVLSGDPTAIANILQELQARNIFCRMVKVDVASHSPQMDPLADELFRFIADIKPLQETTPIYSTVTGELIRGTELDANYWKRNLRSPVLFSKAVQTLATDGHTIFIELSPHPILLSSIEEVLHHIGGEGYAIPSCQREKDERATMLSSLGRLYTIGYPVEWPRLFPRGGRVVALPSYPWQSRRFWLDSPSQSTADPGSLHLQLQCKQEHPLLGIRLPAIAALPTGSVWQTTLRDSVRRYLDNDGASASTTNLAFVEIATAAAREVFGDKLFGLSDLIVRSPLHSSEDGETKIQFVLTKSGNRQASFHVFSCAPQNAEEWQLRVACNLKVVDAEADRIYKLEWKPKPLAHPTLRSSVRKSGCWLIFADNKGIAPALAKVLQDDGEDCRLAFVADSFERRSPNEFLVSPNSPSDILRFLRESFPPECEVHGIVYLWALDSGDALTNSCWRNCDVLLQVVRSLAQMKREKPPQIWLVTQGAQAVDATDARCLSLAQTPLWGLGRVIALEHPDLFGGLIDLPAIERSGISPVELAQRLCLELLASDGEDQVALRDQQLRYATRLVRVCSGAISEKKTLVRSDATYLITGGLGGLGIHLAQWLVTQGARHIVLTSRSGLPERSGWDGMAADSDWGKRIAAVQSLEKSGAEIRVVKVDAADEAQMSELWKELSQTPVPLRGVIHAAGVANSQSLLETTPEHAYEVLHPKVEGSWILHKLSQSDAHVLDFFVMFSSAASQFGAQDMGAYAAANHFMDGLADYRAALGLPVLCVNWGWWDSPGLVSEKLAELFRRSGMKAVPPEKALATLTHLVEIGATRATVADIDWRVFRPLFNARKMRHLLEFITDRQQTEGEIQPQPTENHTGLLKRIEETPVIGRRPLLRNLIRGQVAEILGFSSPEQVTLDRGFFQMGMDSVMTVQLRNWLEANLGRNIPPTVAFEYPTVETLTNFVADQIIEADAPPTVMNEASEELEPHSGIAQEELSEEQLVDLLEKKLEEMR